MTSQMENETKDIIKLLSKQELTDKEKQLLKSYNKVRRKNGQGIIGHDRYGIVNFGHDRNTNIIYDQCKRCGEYTCDQMTCKIDQAFAKDKKEETLEKLIQIFKEIQQIKTELQKINEKLKKENSKYGKSGYDK